MKKQGFQPEWRNTVPEASSFRSIFKWGSPAAFKHPNERLYALLKDTFSLGDQDFRARQNQGDEPVVLGPEVPVGLSVEQVRLFENIVGAKNVASDDYSRVKFSSGKTMEEIQQLRSNAVGRICDLVLHPRNKDDICQIVACANQQRIPVYVYGGGTSVTLAPKPVKGGLTLVTATHMNRVVEFNETNQTITVESGMMGPVLEDFLNHAPMLYNARHAYTCGHFPQSFEFSTVGGWIVTKGSGQMSSYYGDACDMVLSQEYVTPAGCLKTLDYPSTATGPMVNDMLKGSEGAFGVLVSLTLKIFRYQPENRRRFSFLFPSFAEGVSACREISQSQFGMPSVLRISDGEETWVGLKQHGIESAVLERFLSRRGYLPGQRCLMIGHTEGERGFSKNVRKMIGKVCKGYGAMSLTGYPVRKWEKSKFADPYLREDLNDFGIWIDTLETGLTWAKLHEVHTQVRAYIKARPQTLCMTHCSHFYPQGANLYFIFISRFATLEEYKAFQMGIVERIVSSGGSLSHHHGVGKMLAPLMEKHLGKEQMDVLRALKAHFDPQNIMNPGGTLGLD